MIIQIKDFRKKPTKHKARKLFVDFTRGGWVIPKDILEYFLADIEHQVKQYEKKQSPPDIMDELAEKWKRCRLHYALENCSTERGGKKKVYEKFAKEWKRGTWEQVKDVYLQWVKRGKIKKDIDELSSFYGKEEFMESVMDS